MSDDPGVVGRAVMCDVPVPEATWDGHAARRYEFDFRPVTRGVRGYAWAFPCLIDGAPHVNVGVYALPPVSGALLQRELELVLADVGAAPRRWQAFPIRTWVRSAPVAAPGVLLTGDAAGCDPLMGEGISFALEYGVTAADAVSAARTRGGDAAELYQRAVHDGPLGRKLGRLEWGTRRFYGPHARGWFRVARRQSAGAADRARLVQRHGRLGHARRLGGAARAGAARGMAARVTRGRRAAGAPRRPRRISNGCSGASASGTSRASTRSAWGRSPARWSRRRWCCPPRRTSTAWRIRRC